MSESVILFGSTAEMEKHLPIGKPLRIRVDRDEYFLVRLQAAIYLTETKCPHFGYTLENARVNPLGQLVCPWHGYQFDLKTGEASVRDCRPMEVYPTAWDNAGRLIVNLPN